MGVGTLASICMVGVAYAMVKVPQVNADATVQGSTIYYSDGKTVMGKIGSSRQIVKLNEISPAMRDAALAAEDRKFYSESAISPTGIARAVFNNLSGGDTQGGSTITQQYVKNAYLNQQRTFTRKFKEIFISVKVGKQQDKDTILQNYLNTIFFGRGANGIDAAAEAYYKVHAKDLTVQQAAVLAASIKEPDDGSGTSYYDPRSTGQKHLDAIARYNFVLDGMNKMGKLSDADLAKYRDHPTMTVKNSGGATFAGQKGYLIQRVKNAMHNMKFSDQDLQTKGLKIYTTWDKNLQEKAKVAVEHNLQSTGMPKDTRVGLVSINPKNGEIEAAYGGKDYLKRFVDDAFYATAQVGSGFKPYVLATALTQDIGLKSQFDASAPAYFDTKGDRVHAGDPGAFEVHNDEGNPVQPVVNLVTATQMSYNTVYVPLGFKAGSDNVLSLATKAGLPEDAMKPHVGQSGFFLGQSSMSPLDQATGYATIANDGEYIRPHTIRKVLDANFHPYQQSRWKNVEKHRAFDSDVAHDVQYAMQAVVRSPGTGIRAALPGREVAGKTGTTNANKAAWFNGFTPNQLVTSVGMWRYDDPVTKGKNKHAGRYVSMTNVGGLARVNGGNNPAQIWHDYMSSALQGKPVTTFPPAANVGNPERYATARPTPTPTPTPTETPTCRPDQNPMRDHCKPGQDDGTPDCTLHPHRSQCQNSTPPTQPTCQPPFGCQSTPPGGGSGGGKGGNDVQEHAARPIDE
ncbi:transglycosylase domain-containing protein [Actinomadura sp. DC4]|uniref:transglycosylase domain-containing protein n=1 Tax=Actinomadura sp. DC4 TaxID=3055069 RepID=UPI0025AF3D6D|nr:transglycosylase domain-containing protein [Actinomadura sp. DC4]MDN3352861.1 transglycosylase domain-containing protein [Actinomadura sp. DC4]